MLQEQDSSAERQYVYKLDSRIFVPLWKEVEEAINSRLQETLETLNLQESMESLCPSAVKYKLALQNLLDKVKGLDHANINLVNGIDCNIQDFIRASQDIKRLEDTLGQEPKSNLVGEKEKNVSNFGGNVEDFSRIRVINMTTQMFTGLFLQAKR